MKARITFEYNPKDEFEFEEIMAMQRISDYRTVISEFDNWMRNKIKYEEPTVELSGFYFSEDDKQKDQEILNSFTPEQLQFIKEQKTMECDAIRDKFWEMKNEYNIMGE